MLAIILHRGVMSPLILHFFAWIIYSDSNSPMLVLILSLIAVWFTSILVASAEMPLWIVIPCSIWVPVWMSLKRVHWAMNSHSPHAPAAGLLPLSDPSGGQYAHIALSVFAALMGWAWMRADKSNRKRFKDFRWSDYLSE